jgi:hypothetical protein
MAGRVADKRGARFVVLCGILLLSAAYVVMWAAGYWMAGLVVGVLVLDMGQQTMHIGNQTRIFSLVVGARSRLNTVYMIVFFLGGAAGSAASSQHDGLGEMAMDGRLRDGLDVFGLGAGGARHGCAAKSYYFFQLNQRKPTGAWS